MQIPKALDPVEAVKGAFPEAVLDVVQFRDETTLVIHPKEIVNVCRYLRDTNGLIYNFMSDISSVDYYPDYNRPGRFGVCYHLLSMLYNRRLRVKVYLPEDEPVVPTVTGVWQVANWLEREIYDMMGIIFDGHPDLRRVLLPEDWDGHPARRDAPLGYETVMFSFNADEISKHKPFAKE
ncbi:MAG: NADH-quinone oxidoreductase subunit C [Chloroflexi bacterium]|uniref:NADH-quinone oxidoreductase subunit C n=1 Tax=Candidatus Flexifilum breve TaxID=3140694 RepID=UPI0031368776|nr:NADH-quinone oxidoreductase subunit C [Chloroflexota bacterium]